MRNKKSRKVMGILVPLSVLIVTGALFSPQASASVTVLLGSAANYSVLGASTVTNTGGSILHESLGVSPGTAVTGFPPGQVLAPSVIDDANTSADQAQADLTQAYVNAQGRSVDATTTADLTNLNLVGGVYSGPAHSPLLLNGPITLDGQGNLDSVFIFQTDSTITTSSASTVNLINGAQECNVFWQGGSSATLGSNSVFAGNIMAQDSVTVDSGVVVHGRALARTGAVTLDNDTFDAPTCAQTVPTTTTTSTTSTTVPSSTTTTSPSGATTTTSLPSGSTTTVPRNTTGTTILSGIGTTTSTSTTYPRAATKPGVIVPVAGSSTTQSSTVPSNSGLLVTEAPRTGAAPVSHSDSKWWALVTLLLPVGLLTRRGVRLLRR